MLTYASLLFTSCQHSIDEGESHGQTQSEWARKVFQSGVRGGSKYLLKIIYFNLKSWHPNKTVFFLHVRLTMSTVFLFAS